MSDVVTAKDGVPFACPFCQLEAVAVREPPAVLHAEPPCETFLRLDVTDYLHEVNALLLKRQ